MKHITIIVPDGQSSLSSVACIVGAYEIFTRANEYWQHLGKKELFAVQLAGVASKAEFSNGLLAVMPQANIANIAKTNLIIIPSLVPDCQKAMKVN